MSAPTSPTAQGGGAEVVFGQILQTMQAGMQQMAQDSQQRFELLERGLREQSQFLQASATAQMTALETLSKKSNVVDVKGVGKPDVLKGSHEEAKRAWKSWAYKFESWFVSQYPDAGQQALDWAKEKGDTTIFDSDVQQKANTLTDLRKMDGHLHVALVSLTSGMPYDVVFSARKKCGLDAWRRLNHVYEPWNPRSNMRLLRRILVQPRATLDGLRAAIDRWEADLVQRGNRDLDDPQKVTILLSMVPESLEDHLEMNMSRLDTYVKARSEVISYTEQKAFKADADSGGAAPMELDAFKGNSKGSSKGNKGGKGKGKDGNKNNPDKDVVCHLCGKKGHRKANCWHAKANGGSGQPPSQKGNSQPNTKNGKGKGQQKGKGQGKGSKGKAHALEGEAEGDQAAEQEWPDGDEPEREGNLGLLCVARGSSTGSVPFPGRTGSPMDGETATKIVRPEHGNLSWFWSRPWDDVVSECKRDRSRADPIYRCTVPNCKGYYKSFTAHGLEAHLWSKLQTMGHPVQEQWDAWKVAAKRGHYIRPELPGEEEFLRNPVHCGKDPIWVHLPREPDYSKHKDNYESEPGDEEEGMQSAEKEEAQEETTEEESPVSDYIVEELLVGEDDNRTRKSSTASVPSSRSNRSRTPLPRRRCPVEAEEEKPGSGAVSGSTAGCSVGGASSSKPAPYELTAASRAIMLGELLGKRNDELEERRAFLDDPKCQGATRTETLDMIAKLELELEDLKGEQRTVRRKQREGFSSRQERDKEVLGGRLAYLKERSRKRAASKRREGHVDRVKEKLQKEDEWWKRFNQPGKGRKVRVFPLAEGELAGEVQAAPLSKKAKTALLEEEEQAFLELPQHRPRTKELPPSARKLTPKKRAAKHKRERRREQRRKADKEQGKGKGSAKGESRAKGTGHLASFSGSSGMGTATGAYPGWTRVDFVIDSGASATTIPKGLVGKVKLDEPIGYHSFKLADGNVVTNDGTLTAKAWLMGNEVMVVRMSVADISQPLLSVGQMVNQGNKVVLSPKVSYLETKGGGIHRIFQRNGVYVLPLWLDSAKMAPTDPFVGQGHGSL